MTLLTVMLVIGDPEFRLAGQEHVPASAWRLAERKYSIGNRKGIEDEILQLSFVRTCVREGMASSLNCDEEVADDLIGLTLEYEASIISEPSQCDSLGLPVAALRFFSSFSRIAHTWRRFGCQTPVSSGEPCPYCSGETQKFRTNFSMKGVADRINIICPRCGEISDCPEGSQLVLSVAELSAGKISLASCQKNSHNLVSIISRHLPSSLHFPWPVDDVGRPEETFVVPLKSLPQGPLLCRVLSAWDIQIASACIKIRPDGERMSLFSSARPSR